MTIEKIEVSVRMTVSGFSHVRKGEAALLPDGRTKVNRCPGDAIFGEVHTHDQFVFAVSVMAYGLEGAQPHHFEAALRGMIAALAHHSGNPQEDGIVVRDTELQ